MVHVALITVKEDHTQGLHVPRSHTAVVHLDHACTQYTVITTLLIIGEALLW